MTTLLQQLETLHAQAAPLPWVRIGSDHYCRLAVEAVNLLPQIIAVMKAAEGMKDALEEHSTQDGCNCGHPACKRCHRTADGKKAITAYNQATGGAGE